MSTWVIATISLFRDIGSGAVQTGPGRAIMGLLPLHAEADKKGWMPGLGRHPAGLPIALATNRHNRTQQADTQHEPTDVAQQVVEVKFGLVEGVPAPGFTREVVQPGVLPERLLGRNRRGCTGQSALVLPYFELCNNSVAYAESDQDNARNEKRISKQRGDSTHIEFNSCATT